jgi:transglutaminase-like putative cysteine protease
MLVVALATAASAAGVVLAQSASPPRPVPHEPIRELSGGQMSPMIGGSAGQNPNAIAAGDRLLPNPASDTKPKGEPVLGKGGFAADRDTVVKPDENTGADSTLHYVSVFNPDVLPFKRMSSFDEVREDQTLHVHSPALVELPVGATTDPRTRDRFWGDVLVELAPGRDVPLPSVAPDMRILSYEIKPKLAVHFSKDGADNFYVRTDEPSASGTYRLTFAADADAGYFAPTLPPTRYRVRDVLAHAPPELRIATPRALDRDTKLTFDHLAIDRDMDLGVAFNKLVNYFRAFQAGEIRRPTGDTYRDLCDSQTGVCRHRSFAFMITANALGIPTRFVANEAHAFVEVWFPERNWQRIDLGGAALRMDVSGADKKQLHRPRGDDPFAKPPEYKNNYTQLEGEIRGLTQQQLADRRKTSTQAPPSGAVGPDDGTGSDSGTATGSGSGGEHGLPRVSPDTTLDVLAPDPNKKTPVITVTAADTSAYRGGMLHVEGSVRAAGKGLGDHVVQVWIAPPGRRHDSLLLGTAATRDDGLFSADLLIPAKVNLDTYDVLLSCDADAYYNAALSE